MRMLVIRFGVWLLRAAGVGNMDAEMLCRRCGNTRTKSIDILGVIATQTKDVA